MIRAFITPILLIFGLSTCGMPTNAAPKDDKPRTVGAGEALKRAGQGKNDGKTHTGNNINDARAQEIDAEISGQGAQPDVSGRTSDATSGQPSTGTVDSAKPAKSDSDGKVTSRSGSRNESKGRINDGGNDGGEKRGGGTMEGGGNRAGVCAQC